MEKDNPTKNNNPLLDLGHLPDFYRLRWNLRMERDFDTPFFLGSALRGLLGHGLKRTVCVTRQPKCTSCVLLQSCPYPAFFEPAAIHPSNARVPYVLALPFIGRHQFKAGDILPLEMTLLPPHDRQIPYLVHALERAGKMGIGPQRVPFSVASVSCLEKAGENSWLPLYEDGRILRQAPTVKLEPPPLPRQVSLEWLTPLRLKRHGRLVRAEDFDGNLFIESLAFRASDLAASRPERTLLKQIREQKITARTQMHWREMSRYSSRQGTRMQIGGLLGRMDLELAGLEAYWPWIWATQWLHLGKFTSVGLGRYRLTASLPTR